MDKNKATKQELVARVTERLGGEVWQYVVGQVVQATFDEISALLREGRGLELRRFGVFEVAERGARIGRNPKHPEQVVEIPARRVVRFRPGKELQPPEG
ncbi:MAG: integration host factor subunit beta [Kiritimatiellae bacterium]|nr:integration host factor subunit beta [Kiritimatiellia bacterium]